MEFDKIETTILNIQENTRITLTVNGNTSVYTPAQDSDGSIDMKVVNGNDSFYGLSCSNLKEMKYLLLANYTRGVISNAYVAEDDDIIKSCKDCKLHSVCPDAFSEISCNCNMIGEKNKQSCNSDSKTPQTII